MQNEDKFSQSQDQKTPIKKTGKPLEFQEEGSSVVSMLEICKNPNRELSRCMPSKGLPYLNISTQENSKITITASSTER